MFNFYNYINYKQKKMQKYIYMFLFMVVVSLISLAFKPKDVYLEIYTTKDIYYVYPQLMKIELESSSEVLIFNSFESMKDYLSEVTALDTYPSDNDITL